MNRCRDSVLYERPVGATPDQRLPDALTRPRPTLSYPLQDHLRTRSADLAPSLVVRLAIGSAPELSICRSLPARVAGPRHGEPVPGRGTAALTIVQPGISGAPAK